MNSDNHAELASARGPWTRWCLLTLGYMLILFNGSTAVLAADAGSVLANCPAGYTNMGATCSRAAEKYSNPSGVKCREGYTNSGLFCDRPASTLGPSALTCPAGYLQDATNKSRCMPQAGGSVPANAPSNAAVGKCPDGYTNMGVTCSRAADSYGNRSSVANCPPGYTNMGLTCQGKEPKGMDSMTCPAGSDKHGARCYPKCRQGYTNTGETCVRASSILPVTN